MAQRIRLNESGCRLLTLKWCCDWDLVERAAQLMRVQGRHSPALPLLELMVRWRGLGLVEIAQGMRSAGVGMEQLLDAVQKQLGSSGA